ncbi:hypothetical protein UFOVP495_17 [uncultured Caudovirales phage]|uniref:Uncharacterized protein n=1 Tax=uncultured Caudovirales phage TaxID=2100421 RepID=A0A6J5MK89_9CAUD|nr:hypothetical protein UFOVP495_17 [uncultured Caudovirales phage]
MPIQLLPIPTTLQNLQEFQTMEFAPLQITDQNEKTNNDFSQWLLRFVQNYNDTIIQLNAINSQTQIQNSLNTIIVNKINEIIAVVNTL